MGKKKGQSGKRSSLYGALLLFIVGCPVSILAFLWIMQYSYGGASESQNVGQVTEVTEDVEIMATSATTQINDVILSADGVESIIVASERNRETQINGLAMVTLFDDADLIESRDAIWDVWSEHARATYGDDVQLVLDLTITHQGTESIWQYTSNSTEWLQLQ